MKGDVCSKRPPQSLVMRIKTFIIHIYLMRNRLCFWQFDFDE